MTNLRDVLYQAPKERPQFAIRYRIFR